MKLAGNARVVRAISAAGGSNPFHAYIISGPDGSGKTLAARLLSSALVCTSEEALRPCGRCLACRKTDHGTHPDVRVLEMEGKESFLVSQSRELRAEASRLPNEGRHKVFILPDAQHMNEAASNALLKILEEPPEYAVMILIAENPASLPETVRSRCVELRLRPVNESEALPVLRELFPEEPDSALSAAFRASEGLIGRAADRLAGREGNCEIAAEAAAAIFSRDELGLLIALMSLERAGKEEIRRELCALSRTLASAAVTEKACALTKAELAASAAAAAEIYQRSALYISPGNMLAGAAAELARIFANNQQAPSRRP